VEGEDSFTSMTFPPYARGKKIPEIKRRKLE